MEIILYDVATFTNNTFSLKLILYISTILFITFAHEIVQSLLQNVLLFSTIFVSVHKFKQKNLSCLRSGNITDICITIHL